MSTGDIKPVVNPRKWTTKVNIAVVIAVLVVMVIGFIWAIGAFQNPEDVHERVDEEVGRP